MSIKVVSWNINGMTGPEVWQQLLDTHADVALLQEVPWHSGVNRPVVPRFFADTDGVRVGPNEHWYSHMWLHHEGKWKLWSMVVRLSDRVEIEWFKQIPPFAWTGEDEFAVSGIGTAAAARVTPRDGQPFIAVSMYGRWIRKHPTAKGGKKIYPDGAVHRIVSDLSAFIGSHNPSTHRILAAGDLNVAFRSSDRFDKRARAKRARAKREQTILDRMQVLGLEHMGPFHPNGRRADPIPPDLDEDSREVPTFYKRGKSPATAHVQVDHVFASRGFHEEVHARALNRVEEWGGSDHCRILIEVGGDQTAD